MVKLKDKIQNVNLAFLNLENKWVTIKNLDKWNQISNSIRQFGFTGNNMIGFIFVDHYEGLSLVVTRIIDIKNSEITLMENLEDTGVAVIIRYETFKNYDIEIIPQEGVDALGLPDKPGSIEIQNNPELEKIRKNEILHPFRGEGFPDEIKILLPPVGDLKPESIWCRVEQYKEDENIFICELYTGMTQDFKVKPGELVEVVPILVGDKPQLLCKTAFDRLSQK
jgi:hypothetical protein